jgi:hypothetical protein
MAMTKQWNILELRLQRLVELRWVREVIARKLTEQGTLDNTHSRLEEMLARVKAELEALEGTAVGGERDQ